MYSLFRKFGTAFVAIVSDRVVQAVYDMIETASANADEENKALIERVASSQALAAVIYARFGVSGLATAYDYGVISVADFAMYVVKGLAWRISPVSADKVKELEDKARDTGFWAQSFNDLSDVTTDPSSVAAMYSYLLSSKTSF